MLSLENQLQSLVVWCIDSLSVCLIGRVNDQILKGFIRLGESLTSTLTSCLYKNATGIWLITRTWVVGWPSLGLWKMKSLIIADFQKLAGEDSEDASECCRSSSI
jgi:hypothetical protein